MVKEVCILVPVHNVEKNLRSRISNLLEVVSELTSSFEIRIVDDGSMDATSEIANEIANEFPQINVASRQRQLGLVRAVQQEIQQLHGEMIIVYDLSQPLSDTFFRELWGKANGHSESPTAVASLTHDRMDSVHLQHGLQLIKRRQRSASVVSATSSNNIGAPIKDGSIIDRLSQVLHSR